jgi:hypothetical protein
MRSLPGARSVLVPVKVALVGDPSSKKETGCEMWWDGEWRLMERMDPVSLWTTSGRRAQQHGTPWTAASGIMLDSGEGLVDAKTRDSNQQHQEVNSTQDRGTGSARGESSTNGGY